MYLPRYKKISIISFILFSFLAFLTLFAPCISIDSYVEYDFNYGYYNETYQSHIIPVASKIAPIDILSTCFSKQRNTQYKFEYTELKASLDEKLASGEINENDYNLTLANSRITGKYYIESIHNGSSKNLAPLQNKLSIYSIVILIFYLLCLLIMLINLIYLFTNKKILSIANFFIGWICVIMIGIFIIYTFSMAVLVKNKIAGFDGNIMEEITTCLSPNIIPFILFFSFIAYSFIAMAFDNKDSKIKKRNSEIPIEITNSLATTNKYRKINGKKRKYKNGSKKKRYR